MQVSYTKFHFCKKESNFDKEKIFNRILNIDLAINVLQFEYSTCNNQHCAKFKNKKKINFIIGKRKAWNILTSEKQVKRSWGSFLNNIFEWILLIMTKVHALNIICHHNFVLTCNLEQICKSQELGRLFVVCWLLQETFFDQAESIRAQANWWDKVISC